MAKGGVLKVGMPRRRKPERGAAPPQPEASAREYEVRCHACDVSFPVGTKRCMYCGDRLGQRPLFAPPIHAEPFEDFGPLGDFAPHPEVRESEPQTRTSPQPFGEPDDEEAEPTRGTFVRLLGSLSWVLVFLAITIYQACTG
ncbi:MAG: hypothetical protein QF570_18170 [Myxococcota bacterium]|jgi:hypothetical protein|nr:hypothetical protein [Myxococcota bacterium]